MNRPAQLATYPVYRADLICIGREPNQAGIPQDVFRADLHQIGQVRALTAELALTKAKLSWRHPIVGQPQSEALQ